MESVSRFIEINGPTMGNGNQQQQQQRGRCGYGRGLFGYNFQLPLHYPRYTRAEYEAMPEWLLDCLLQQYGLPVIGDVDEKRRFAIGAFVWSENQKG